MRKQPIYATLKKRFTTEALRGLRFVQDGSRMVKLGAWVVAKPLMNQPKEEFRVIDRRLQALRKKSVIAWERRGSLVVWSLSK